jgi:predicted phosphate transport protein (TIGR00153 family)
MARFRLIPREEKFFEDFVTHADEVRRGARLLEEMLAPEPPVWNKADLIKECEHRCDQLTHDVLRRLNRTFVTPLDREDLYAMARNLDDVMDAIDAAAGFVRIYHIEHVRDGARELASIITQSVDQIHRAMQVLDSRHGIMDLVVEINRLENEADLVHSQSIERLFAEERDPIVVIKWKEILNYLEEATDRCEDVANLLESIVVKYA